MVYNLLSCGGFDTSGFMDFGGACMSSRLGIVLLFFIIAIVRKWGGEEMGFNFNFLFALILGLFPYIIIITIFGSMKIAFLIGLVGMLIGGYGVGMFFGGDEGGWE